MNITDKIVQENKDKIDMNISNYLKKKMTYRTNTTSIR
jgi:transcription termination factor NusB